MPYADPDKQREYQNQWIQARRALFFRDRCCCDCYSRENLELDHEDPSKKWKHRIWSYSWEKIMKEADKCRIRCSGCHLKKTVKDIIEMRKKSHGTKDGYDKYHCRCDKCVKFQHESLDQYTAGLSLAEAKEMA